MNKDNDLLVIYFPDSMLDHTAEILKIETDLIDLDQTYPYKNYADELFEAFNARQKHYIMQKIFEKEIDINYYQNVGIIVDHFPLHEP